MRSARDMLIERRLQQELPAERREAALADALSVVEVALGKPGESIDGALNRFFDAFAALSQSPSSSVARQEVLLQAESLADSFRDMAERISRLAARHRRAGQLGGTGRERARGADCEAQRDNRPDRRVGRRHRCTCRTSSRCWCASCPRSSTSTFCSGPMAASTSPLATAGRWSSVRTTTPSRPRSWRAWRTSSPPASTSRQRSAPARSAGSSTRATCCCPVTWPTSTHWPTSSRRR